MMGHLLLKGISYVNKIIPLIWRKGKKKETQRRKSFSVLDGIGQQLFGTVFVFKISFWMCT